MLELEIRLLRNAGKDEIIEYKGFTVHRPPLEINKFLN